MSGSGISWAVCKSAPRSKQITTPAPHHSVFYRLDALPAAHWRLLKSRENLPITCRVILFANRATVASTSGEGLVSGLAQHSNTIATSTITSVHCGVLCGPGRPHVMRGNEAVLAPHHKSVAGQCEFRPVSDVHHVVIVVELVQFNRRLAAARGAVARTRPRRHSLTDSTQLMTSQQKPTTTITTSSP